VGGSTGVAWLLQDIGVPLGICSLTGLLASFALRGCSWPDYGRLGFAMLLAAGSVAATVAVSPGLRAGMRAAVRAELGR